jgi:hypothetical protein
MNDEISRLLLLAIFFLGTVIIADWAVRRMDRDDDE